MLLGMQASDYEPNVAAYVDTSVPVSVGQKQASCYDEWPDELDDSYIGWLRNTIRFRVWLGL